MSAIHIPLNLSNEPFRKDRPLLVASAVTAALLAGLLLLLVMNIYNQREAAKESRELKARIDAQLRNVNGEYSRLESQLRQPAASV